MPVALGLAIVILTAACGLALAYALAAGAFTAYIAAGHSEYIAFWPQRVFSQLDIFALMAMPLFILTGELMNRGGVTRALIALAMAIVGRLPGGLGHVNVITSFFFAGISGSAVADTAAMSRILVPAMKEEGYDSAYAAAITAASSIIGPIIPPSIILIFYGALMGVDVAALFLGGVGPGLVLAAALLTMNAYLGRKYGKTRATRPALAPAFLKAAPALAVPFIVMSGIVLGWMTPTEAAAVAVLCAGTIGVLQRTLQAKDILEAFKRAAMLTGAIFALIAAASVWSFLAALSALPERIDTLIEALNLTGTPYLLVMTVILLLVGMFLDIPIALALLAPILVPPALAAGADPVHIGVFVCFNLCIGLLTPPLGGCLIVTSASTGVPYLKLAKALTPFILVEIIVLIIILFTPDIVTFIPKWAGVM
ncbi:MAG: TRAP transporter large permease [Pseudomonadota bacterium]